MLKIQESLRSRIILLLLDGLLLGSITFSVTGCQAVNLMNQILFHDQEQKVKQTIDELLRGQHSYRIEDMDMRFANSVEELGVQITTNPEIYSYQIYRGIQTDLNNYQFLSVDKVPKQSLKILEDESFTSPKKLPQISPDILMISARPKKPGLKTFIGFMFTCYDASTGGSDCGHESLAFSMLYESEKPSTLPPHIMKVSLPLDFCGLKRGCLREKVPTPEGFRPVEGTNRE